MIHKSKIKYPFLYILLMLAVTAGAISLLYQNKEVKTQMELEGELTNFKTAYKASVSKYKLATKEAYDLAINQEDITNILYNVAYEQGYDESVQRGLLYRKLLHVYDSLKKKDVRQLHFHLPDGESFLRFHKLSKYGDNLFDARPSILRANKNKEFVSGFEMGKVVSGHRFVYPLFFQKFFVGTVETSIAVKAIMNSMRELNPSNEYAFILRKDLVKKYIFEEQKALFSSSKISEDFMIEDPQEKLRDSPEPLSAMAKNINKKLAKDTKAKRALKEFHSYATYLPYKNTYVAVSLLPMQGVQRGVEGYLIAYKKDDTPAFLKKEFNIFALAVIAVNIIIALLILLADRKAKINEQQHEALSTLMNTLAEGVYVVNQAGKITEANKTAMEILGFSQKVFIGANPHTLFHAHKENKNMPLKQCPLNLALQNGKKFYSDNETFKKADGQIVPVSIKAKPMVKEGQNYQVVAFEDITQRKKHLQALELAKEQAQAGLRAKSQFVANMSHEIRTPLNAIMALGDFMEDTNLDERQKELLSKQKNSSKLLLQILNDILDYSKIEAGKLELEYIKMHSYEIVKQAKELFGALAQQKDIDFHVTYTKELPSLIKGDKLRLIQILNNILGNAFKFTQAGSVRLHVSAQKIGSHKALLVLEVTDTGIGIKEETMGTLFEPFVQEDLSTTRRFGGSGLGLSISKKIVDLMHGSIDISSKPNEGSIFRVEIPAEVLSWEPARTLDEKPEAKEQTPNYKKKTFLIVEDNSINQEVLKSLVEKTGAKAVLAEDGQEALDIFKQKGDVFEAVFMDMHMPIMNGFEASKEIRKINPKIPIIAVSAATSDDDKQKAFDCGITVYLSKPIEPNSFYKTLKKYCKQSKEVFKEKRKKGSKQVVLIVDDVPSNIHILSKMLKDEYAIKVATSGERAIEITNETHVDLILLDIIMPKMDGYEVCKHLKSDEANADIPIIFVTAKDSVEDETYGLSIGAVDYITKPYSQGVVKARVARHMKLKQKTDSLEVMSMEDGLTKIPNRRSFDHFLESSLKKANQKAEALSVMMIDIDYFKPYNDNYGHEQGDKALYAVAQCLKNELKRPGDFVARYGGEEFVVILQGGDFLGVKKVAKRLVASIRELQMEHEYSKVSKVLTISLGLIYCENIPKDVHEDKLVHRADEALYEAKAAGRDGFVSYKGEDFG